MNITSLLPAYLEALLQTALEKLPQTPSGVSSFFFVRESLTDEDDPDEIVVPNFVMPTQAQRKTFFDQLKVRLMARGVIHVATHPCVWSEMQMWGGMVTWAQSKEQLQNVIDIERATLEMLENPLN